MSALNLCGVKVCRNRIRNRMQNLGRCTEGGLGLALEFQRMSFLVQLFFAMDGEFTRGEIMNKVLIELSFFGEPDEGAEFTDNPNDNKKVRRFL